MQVSIKSILPEPFNENTKLRAQNIGRGLSRMRQAHASCIHLAEDIASAKSLNASVYNAADVLTRRVGQPLPVHPALKRLNSFFAHISNDDIKELFRSRISLLFKEAKHRGNEGRFTFEHAAKIVAGGAGIDYGVKMLMRLQRCGVGKKYSNFGKPIFDLHIYRHWAVADAVAARHKQVKADAFARNQKRAPRTPKSQEVPPTSALMTPPPRFLQDDVIIMDFGGERDVVNIEPKSPSYVSPPLPTSETARADLKSENPQPSASGATIKKPESKGDEGKKRKGDFEKIEKGNLSDAFMVRAMQAIARGKEAAEAKCAAQDEWEAGKEHRMRATSKLEVSQGKRPPVCATQISKFITPDDDAYPVDAQWLRKNLAGINELRLLAIEKTVRCQYTRAHVRAAAASLVSNLPGQCVHPLARFVAALRLSKTGEWPDARLRNDIRLAKHGWSLQLYKLSMRWPQDNPGAQNAD